MSNLIAFGTDNFYTLDKLQHITLEELEEMPTLEEGFTDDLKLTGIIQRQDGYSFALNQFKLWQSRTSIEDGEEYDNKITLEIFDKNFNRWITLKEWEAPKYPF